jgi:cytochrome b
MNDTRVDSLPSQAASPAARGVLVWDWPVRLMHWGLALAVFGCWATQELEGDYFAWHVRFGYAVLVIVLVRIVWGFAGTRYARFSAFVRGPASILRYARSLFRGPHERHVGHNPLGALAILAMLTALLVQAITGLFANDQIMNVGPLFGYIGSTLSDRITTIHKQLFDGILWLVGLHVAAALGYWLVKRENLIVPMLTGRKSLNEAPLEAEIRSSRLVLWIALLALAGGALYTVVSAAPEGSLSFF